MVNTRTKLLGIIGDPIEHSLSPNLHNFVIQKMKLNFCYHAFHVAAKDLKRALDGFSALKFVGINVTLPHKEKIISLLDELSPEARALGAVNTVHFNEGRAIGYNTDYLGFINSISEYADMIRGKMALVVGAGGAARAVIYALIMSGISSIKLYNRSLENADRMVHQIIETTNFSDIQTFSIDDLRNEQKLDSAAIIVNCTPVGMVPHLDRCPIPEDFYFNEGTPVVDLIYNPRETELLKRAKASGANTVSGLDMLIYQGLEALKIWTGSAVDAENIFSELRAYLLWRLSGHE